MPWPEDSNELLVKAFGVLGLRGWDLSIGHWDAAITADPAKRKAIVAIGNEPADREEAACTLVHEAAHALVAKHMRANGRVNLDGLLDDLQKRIGKQKAADVMAAVEETFCDTVGEAVGPKLIARKPTRKRAARKKR